MVNTCAVARCRPKYVIFGMRGTKNIDIYNVNGPEGLQKFAKPKLTPFWDPARIAAIINDSNESKHLSLDFFVYFFWRCWCGDAFYTDTLLQTDTKRTAACTQSSFYSHMLLHREVCAQRSFYTQMPLHTEAFTQRNFYTQKRPRSALFDRTCTIAV